MGGGWDMSHLIKYREGNCPGGNVMDSLHCNFIKHNYFLWLCSIIHNNVFLLLSLNSILSACVYGTLHMYTGIKLSMSSVYGPPRVTASNHGH